MCVPENHSQFLLKIFALQQNIVFLPQLLTFAFQRQFSPKPDSTNVWINKP